MISKISGLATVLSVVLASMITGAGANAWGGNAIPVCPAGKQALPVNNEQVVVWRNSVPNQFRARGHVLGPVTRIFPDATGHDHFEVSIGKSAKDTIEVIYNAEFGELPQIRVGDEVEACGDFIQSTAQAGPYPPSPSGAIIHWVHINPRGNGHDSGFLVINDSVYGLDATNADRGDRRNYGNSGSNRRRR